MEEMSFATEWDGCWFCTCCGKMIHWKTKGYKDGNNKLCTECSKLSKEERNKIKIRYRGGH